MYCRTGLIKVRYRTGQKQDISEQVRTDILYCIGQD